MLAAGHMQLEAVCVSQKESDVNIDNLVGDESSCDIEKGVQFGRKSKLREKEIEQLRREREKGTKIPELMSKYSISKASVYRLLAS